MKLELQDYAKRQLEIHSQHDLGALDTNPLIKEISGFDTTYMYSDCGQTWRNGESEFSRISALIEESDYSTKDKKILRGGLSYDKTANDKFKRRFPFSEMSNAPSVTALLHGQAEHVAEVVAKVDKLLCELTKVFEYKLPPYRDNFIYTSCAPNPRDLDAKIMVDEKTQELILNVEKRLTKGDLDTFRTTYYHFKGLLFNDDYSYQLTKYQGGSKARWELYMREKNGNRYFNIFLPS